MENGTHKYHLLMIEGLKVSNHSSYVAFVFLFFAYLFTMVANIGLVVIISMEKTLHEPMYLLFCNLPLSDVIGATAIVPSCLKDLFSGAAERYITYTACVIQAYWAHIFGATSHTMLMIMAYDRYVAICNPLKYTTIMTNNMVVKISVFAWGVVIILVGILLGLTIRLSHCRSKIAHPFCDNPSLFKLSCDDLFINEVYGLTFTVVLWASSIGSIGLTYTRIAIICFRNKSNSLRMKGMKTCSTHLVMYLILLGCSFTIIVLHRFPSYAELGKLASILFSVVPTGLNPLIYGLQTTKIRKKLFSYFVRTRR